jgi:Mrp family chromosome partitioning ATPase
MTNNFEIAWEANHDQELFQTSSSGAVPAATRRPGFDLKEQTREETVRLVRQVFFSGVPAPQVVVFSAVERDSGCTWVCAHAAEILAAHVDGMVCIVDGDLRTPSLHRHFGIEPPPGANEEFISVPVRPASRPLDRSNLRLLSSGSTSADFQSSHRFERLRSRLPVLRNDFAYVLIDAPPINAYADAALLGEVADGLVMVLEANNTRREAALRAKETLNAAGVRLLGAVLNKRTFPIPEKLYRNL